MNSGKIPAPVLVVERSDDEDAWTDEDPDFQSYRLDVREALQEIWPDT